MTRAALEHILGAATAITNEREFVVIGSQAVLGQYPDPAVLGSRLDTLALSDDRIQALRERLGRLVTASR